MAIFDSKLNKYFDFRLEAMVYFQGLGTVKSRDYVETSENFRGLRYSRQPLGEKIRADRFRRREQQRLDDPDFLSQIDIHGSGVFFGRLASGFGVGG